MLRIRLLGNSTLDTGSHLSRKQRLLLFILATERRPFLRSDLAQLLWPSSPIPRAKRSLNQSIYTLRKALGRECELTFSGDEIELDPNTNVDTFQFLHAIESGDDAAACLLYKGPFAPSLTASEGELDDFLSRARWMFHGRARELCLRLTRDLALTDVPALCDCLLSADPYDTDIRRSKIQALGGLGRFVEARNCFEDTCRTWREDLGCEWPHPLPLFAGSGRTPFGKRGALFVGRKQELETLRAAWQETRAAEPRLVIIQGEAGVGKTFLMNRFRRILALQGGATGWASASSLEQRIPFGVVTQWLDDIGAPYETLLQHAKAVRLPAEFGSTTLGRRGLYRAVASSLITKEEGTCLFLDDLAWADDPSRGFLGFLQREWQKTPLLIVASLREPRGLLDALPEASIVRLGGLNQPEVQELVNRVVEDAAELSLDRIAATVFRRTAGNPLLISALLSEGQGALVDNGSISPTVLEFLKPRVEGLSPTARLLLGALAIVGGVPLPTLRTLVEPANDRFSSAVAELTGMGLINDDGSVVSPKHELIADVALRSLGHALERQLRGRAARLFHDELGAPPAKSAPQFDLAGHRERAYDAALRAAGAATDLFAPSEAEYFLKIALINAPDDEASISVRCQLAEAQVAQRRYNAATQTLDGAGCKHKESNSSLHVRAYKVLVDLLALRSATALEAAEQFLASGGTLLPIDLRARLTSALTSAAHGLADQQMVLRAMDRSLQLLPAISNRRLRVRVGLRTGVFIAMYRDAEEGLGLVEAHFTEAEDWPDTFSFRYGARGSARFCAGHAVGAEEDLLECLQLAEATGYSEPMLLAINNLGTLYQETGRFEEARRLYERAMELNVEEKVPTWLQTTLDNLTITFFEEQDYEAAAAAAESALGHFSADELSSRTWVSQNALMGMSFLGMGRLSAAFECWREIGSSCLEASYASCDTSYTELFISRIYEIQGRTDDAVVRLREQTARYKSRDFYSTARMEVELLRLLMSSSPELVLKDGPSLRDKLMAAHAFPSLERLDSILHRTALVSR